MLVGSLLLRMALAQDTGGFYIGPPSINRWASTPNRFSVLKNNFLNICRLCRESDGQCTDNKGQGIPEGLLFTPGEWANLDFCRKMCVTLNVVPVKYGSKYFKNTSPPLKSGLALKNPPKKNI